MTTKTFDIQAFLDYVRDNEYSEGDAADVNEIIEMLTDKEAMFLLNEPIDDGVGVRFRTVTVTAPCGWRYIDWNNYVHLDDALLDALEELMIEQFPVDADGNR